MTRGDWRVLLRTVVSRCFALLCERMSLYSFWQEIGATDDVYEEGMLIPPSKCAMGVILAA